jgi:hypothetical protein
MTHRVNALVNPMQSPDPSAIGDPVSVKTGPAQLADRYDAMLMISDFSHPEIDSGAFVEHIPTKAPGGGDSPPTALELPATCGRLALLGRQQAHTGDEAAYPGRIGRVFLAVSAE